MSNLIKVIDKTIIRGKEIQIIEGGFGEGKKCLTDKQISEIHSMQVKHVREAINNNIKRFKIGIDIIDLKGVEAVDNNNIKLKTLGYNNMQIAKSKNIYLLSERGYAKLIKIMDSDLAWDIMDELICDYFSIRKELREIKSAAIDKSNLLLQLFSDDPMQVATAHKQLVGIETKELVEKIEEQTPLVSYAETCLKSEQSILIRELAKLANDEGIDIGQNRLYDKLRDWNYIQKRSTEPTQEGMRRGYFEVVQRYSYNPRGNTVYLTTKVKQKGALHIINKLKKEYLHAN